jgi:hypothetical protein
MMLLSEKERTRHRFAEMRQPHENSEDDEHLQQQKQYAAAKGKNSSMQQQREKKKNVSQKILQMQNFQSPVLAQKVCSSLQEDILSFCKYAENGLLPTYTPFSLSEEDNMKTIINEMKMVCPSLCSSERRQDLVFMVLNNL